MNGVCIGCTNEQHLAGHVDGHGRWVCVVCGKENQVPAAESGKRAPTTQVHGKAASQVPPTVLPPKNDAQTRQNATAHASIAVGQRLQLAGRDLDIRRVISPPADSGQAAVYEVGDRQGSAFALKLYSAQPDPAAWPSREAWQALSDLSSRHIMRLVAYGIGPNGYIAESSQHHFELTQLVEGTALSTQVRHDPTWIRQTFLPGMRAALEKLGSSSLVHLDIKPGNIMLDKGKQPVLIDFGSAKLLGTRDVLHHTEVVALTRHFAPPELILDRLIHSTTDTYCLGMVLLWMFDSERVVGRQAIERREQQTMGLPVIDLAGDLAPLGRLINGLTRSTVGRRWELKHLAAWLDGKPFEAPDDAIVRAPLPDFEPFSLGPNRIKTYAELLHVVSDAEQVREMLVNEGAVPKELLKVVRAQHGTGAAKGLEQITKRWLLEKGQAHLAAEALCRHFNPTRSLFISGAQINLAGPPAVALQALLRATDTRWCAERTDGDQTRGLAPGREGWAKFELSLLALARDEFEHHAEARRLRLELDALFGVADRGEGGLHKPHWFERLEPHRLLALLHRYLPERGALLPSNIKLPGADLIRWLCNAPNPHLSGIEALEVGALAAHILGAPQPTEVRSLLANLWKQPNQPLFIGDRALSHASEIGAVAPTLLEGIAPRQLLSAWLSYAPDGAPLAARAADLERSNRSLQRKTHAMTWLCGGRGLWLADKPVKSLAELQRCKPAAIAGVGASGLLRDWLVEGLAMSPADADAALTSTADRLESGVRREIASVSARLDAAARRARLPVASREPIKELAKIIPATTDRGEPTMRFRASQTLLEQQLNQRVTTAATNLTAAVPLRSESMLTEARGRLDLLDAGNLPPIRTGTIAALASMTLAGATLMGKAASPEGFCGAAVALGYTAAVGYPTHAVERVVWTTLGLMSCLALSQVDPNWAISFAQPDLVSSDWVAAPWALQAAAAFGMLLLSPRMVLLLGLVGAGIWFERGDSFPDFLANIGAMPWHWYLGAPVALIIGLLLFAKPIGGLWAWISTPARGLVRRLMRHTTRRFEQERQLGIAGIRAVATGEGTGAVKRWATLQWLRFTHLPLRGGLWLMMRVVA
jgi:hypothetical protein